MKEVFATVEWLTIPDAMQLLNLPLGKVHRLIEEHHLVETRIDGIRKIPADAIQNGEPLPTLKGTLQVLFDAGLSNDEALEWLYTEDDTLGSTPMAGLVAGKRAQIRSLALLLF
ncbi:MAG: Rv2175c family DNA-binding protein [Micrococcales bacterium]